MWGAECCYAAIGEMNAYCAAWGDEFRLGAAVCGVGGNECLLQGNGMRGGVVLRSELFAVAIMLVTQGR